MATTPKTTLMGWIVSRWKPTVAQFKAFAESYWHKNDYIPIQQIDGLDQAIGGLAAMSDVEQLLSSFATKTYVEALVGGGAQINHYNPNEPYSFSMDKPTLVLYNNAQSTDENFVEPALFLLLAGTDVGESPEASPSKWYRFTPYISQGEYEPYVVAN